MRQKNGAVPWNIGKCGVEYSTSIRHKQEDVKRSDGDRVALQKNINREGGGVLVPTARKRKRSFDEMIGRQNDNKNPMVVDERLHSVVIEERKRT